MTRVRNLLRAVALAIVVALLGLPAASIEPASAANVYTYDASSHGPAHTYNSIERWPPACGSVTFERAGRSTDDESCGALEVVRGAVASACATYSAPTAFGHVDRTACTAGRAAAADADPSSLHRLHVAANSGRVVANACRTNSFTGDTLVLMADGSKKPIKDVKLGEKVMATDPETGESGPRKVIDLIRHGGLHTMVALRLSDGSTIDATDQHPFWVESRSAWVDAIDLQPGDVVLIADGDRLAVASLGISEQDLTAYNLTVAGLHTYFAGESAVLVHNTRCTNIADLPASAVRNLTEDSGYAFSRLSQNHGVTRIEFREQIHMIKRNENLPADFNLSFGPTGDVWNPRTGELIGGIVRGG